MGGPERLYEARSLAGFAGSEVLAAEIIRASTMHAYVLKAEDCAFLARTVNLHLRSDLRALAGLVAIREQDRLPEPVFQFDQDRFRQEFRALGFLREASGPEILAGQVICAGLSPDQSLPMAEVAQLVGAISKRAGLRLSILTLAAREAPELEYGNGSLWEQLQVMVARRVVGAGSFSDAVLRDFWTSSLADGGMKVVDCHPGGSGYDDPVGYFFSQPFFGDGTARPVLSANAAEQWMKLRRNLIVDFICHGGSSEDKGGYILSPEVDAAFGNPVRGALTGNSLV